MGIFDKVNSGFHSLGNWFESNVAHPFSNKILNPLVNALTPIGNDLARPFRVIENMGSGVEKMSEAWANRAKGVTTDLINTADKTIVGIGDVSQGFGNLFKTPFIPIALGLGAVYILKK